MTGNYSDITKRIEQKPKWWDEDGVPRYAKFHPKWCPDIHAKELILYVIACQDCKKQFRVQESWSSGDDIERLSLRTTGTMEIHYGDPPAHGCVGDTMNCFDIKILEFWQRSGRFEIEWARIKSLEVALPDWTESPLLK